MSTWLQALVILCAVGTATVAGTFFTFSTFTIKGLARLAPAQGAATMQEINKEAPTAPFMLLLFGTGAACLVLVVHAALHLQEPAALYHLAAGALYLVGVILMTGTYHVPRNNILESLDPASAEGMAYWATYLTEWVRMNHVRTIAPLISSILLALSLQMD